MKKQISIEKDEINYMSLGQDYLAKGEDMKAIRAFNKHLKQADDDLAMYLKGKARYNLGCDELAVKDFTTVIENNPEINYNTIEALWALNLRAEIYESWGMLDEALADLNLACKYDSDNAVNFSDRAFIHKELGHYKMALRDITKAMKLASDMPCGLIVCYERRAGILLEGFKDKKNATKDLLVAQTLRKQLKEERPD